MLMGMTLTRQGALEGALRQFQDAVRIAPAQAAAHYNVADTYAALGRLDEAAAAYLQTLRLDPRNREAQRRLDAIAARSSLHPPSPPPRPPAQ